MHSLTYTFPVSKSCRKFVMGKLANGCPYLFEIKPDMGRNGNFGGGDGTTKLPSGEPSFSQAALLIFLATARFRNNKLLFVGRGLALISETTPACTISNCQSLVRN